MEKLIRKLYFYADKPKAWFYWRWPNALLLEAADALASMRWTPRPEDRGAQPSISESHPADCPMCGLPVWKDTNDGDWWHVQYGTGCLLTPVKGTIRSMERWNKFCEEMKNSNDQS